MWKITKLSKFFRWPVCALLGHDVVVRRRIAVVKTVNQTNIINIEAMWCLRCGVLFPIPETQEGANDDGRTDD